MDWEDIKVLGGLTRHGTVRGAAKALGLHHSTVSRRIEALEHAAGVRLFDRTPEGYVLTEAGEHLARSAETMEGEVLRARRLIAGGDRNLAGRITVTMPDAIAVGLFADRLPEFFARYPNLELEVSSTTQLVDLSRMQADVAIRLDNNPPESLFGKRMFPYFSAIYASPEYLERRRDTPETMCWINWDRARAPHPVWATGTRFAAAPAYGYFPAVDLQAAMARSGAGLAMLPCFVGDRDAGLVRAGDDAPVKAQDIWILTHGDLRRTTRIRAFMKFAETVISDNRALLQGDRPGGG